MTTTAAHAHQSGSNPKTRRFSNDDGGSGEHDSESDSSLSTFQRLLPNSLRQCLSGQEQHKSGLLMTIAPSTSSTEPLLRVMPEEDGTLDSASCNSGTIRKRRSKTCPAGMDGDSYHDARSGDNCSHDCGAACSDDCPNVVGSLGTDSSVTSDVLESEYDFETSDKAYSFLVFRLSYLFVTLVVMLADGLQGVYLYPSITCCGCCLLLFPVCVLTCSITNIRSLFTSLAHVDGFVLL
jgi:hypothetical protein